MKRLMAIMLIAALLVGACGRTDDSDSADDDATLVAVGMEATFAAQSQSTATSSVTVLPTSSSVPESTATDTVMPRTETTQSANTPAIASIIIPSIGVEAPVVVRSTDDCGAMQTPDDPWSVAWYDFSAHPLNEGNAVFSGHVDDADVGPTVFWRLKDLLPGDQIHILLVDGSVVAYTVTTMMTVDTTVDQESVDQIVGFTKTPSVTLITCAGRFDASTGQYDQRLIVRAEKVPLGE